MNIHSLITKTLRNTTNNVILPHLPARIEHALRKADQHVKRLRYRQVFLETTQFIAHSMPSVPSFPDALGLLEHAISQRERAHDALVCEFGVGSGRTINHIARLFPEIPIFGFDSFEGLPEDWRPGFPKGTYATHTLPKVLPNVILIRGWFQDTLTAFLDEHPGTMTFLHIDCDLYSSTKTVLQTCQARIQPGTVIVFDEYFNYPGWRDGEYKAFMEFIESTSCSYQYLGFCQYEEQVALKILS